MAKPDTTAPAAPAAPARNIITAEIVGAVLCHGNSCTAVFPDYEPGEFDAATASLKFRIALRTSDCKLTAEGPSYRAAKGGPGGTLVDWHATGVATMPFVATMKQKQLPGVK